MAPLTPDRTAALAYSVAKHASTSRQPVMNPVAAPVAALSPGRALILVGIWTARPRRESVA